MNVKVMYSSHAGNTKKIADTIAQTFRQTAEAVPPAYPLDNVKLLFLGSGIYGGKVDGKMTDFIKTLDVKKVRNVALFGTSGNGGKAAIAIMKKLLLAQGIHVVDESFTCTGKFFLFFQMGHPNADDLKNAQEFAGKISKELE